MAFKVWASCESKDRNRVASPVAEHLSPEKKRRIVKDQGRGVSFFLDLFRLKVPACWTVVPLLAQVYTTETGALSVLLAFICACLEASPVHYFIYLIYL